MVVVTPRRVWLTFSSCAVTAALLCWVLYLLAVRGGFSTELAVLFAGGVFIVSMGALGLGALRRLRNPEWNPWSNPPTPNPTVVFWVATGVVVPVLAHMFYLGASFIVALILTAIQAMGFPIASIAEPIFWIAAVISLGCASAAWWGLWKQYKASLKKMGIDKEREQKGNANLSARSPEISAGTPTS